MRSPWIDLLCLHGYVIDPPLLRHWAEAQPTAPLPLGRGDRVFSSQEQQRRRTETMQDRHGLVMEQDACKWSPFVPAPFHG
jgi:hypothetical protein